MERREGARKCVDIVVKIEYLSGMPGRRMSGRILNVSISGLYLEVAGADVAEYARLRLMLGPTGRGGGHNRIWHCFVVRVTDGGVGAMFENADPSDIDGLLPLLRSAPGRPGSEGGDVPC